MSVPPKEIRKRITDRKRQQHGEADLAKSPADGSHKAVCPCCQSEVLITSLPDDTRHRFAKHGDCFNDCLFSGELVVAPAPKKSPAKLNRELANVAAEKGVLSVSPLADELPPPKPPCQYCGGDGWFTDQDGDRTDCFHCAEEPAPTIAEQINAGAESMPALVENYSAALAEPALKKKRRLGRFHDDTRLLADYKQGVWHLRLTVPLVKFGTKHFEISHSGVHTALEALWKQYCRWKEAQPKEPTCLKT